MQKRVLVTGGAGYVGAHCAKAFRHAGWDVITYDNLSRGWREFVKWGDFVHGDIMDAPTLTRVVREYRPTAIAHFAALAYVAESFERPDAYFRTNLVGLMNVLDAMRSGGVDKLIFSSSCATYGIPTRAPITEEHPQTPINPYGWSKLFAERAIQSCADVFGYRYAILRYFNAAGADPEGEIGERHDPEPHVIPLALRGALSDDYVFTILGSDYSTRDGTAVRDYVHVADLADGHCRALEYLEQGARSDVFNLGTGVGTSVAEIAAAVEAISGSALRRKIGPRRVGDPPSLVADPTKANSILGWAPSRSSISQIIQDAWKWHQSEDAKG